MEIANIDSAAAMAVLEKRAKKNIPERENWGEKQTKNLRTMFAIGNFFFLIKYITSIRRRRETHREIRLSTVISPLYTLL